MAARAGEYTRYTPPAPASMLVPTYPKHKTRVVRCVYCAGDDDLLITVTLRENLFRQVGDKYGCRFPVPLLPGLS